jgi:hypothetical protein
MSPDNETLVVFRLERINSPDNSSWAEKLLDYEVKGKTKWSVDTHLVQGDLFYHIDNLEQRKHW